MTKCQRSACWASSIPPDAVEAAPTEGFRQQSAGRLNGLNPNLPLARTPRQIFRNHLRNPPISIYFRRPRVLLAKLPGPAPTTPSPPYLQR